MHFNVPLWTYCVYQQVVVYWDLYTCNVIFAKESAT